MINTIIITVIITILIYSTITFVVSEVISNSEVDQILLWGVVGMTLWFVFTPLRRYTRNGFYICRFYKDGQLIDTVFIKGGEKSYQKLREKYPKDEYDCFSDCITLFKYLKGKYV